MSPARSFAITARLALVTTMTMFLLIIVGSIVRTTGSGLACPDWPLCHGRLIPPFQFNILIEWFHRLLALIVSVMLAATVVWVMAHRAVRSRLAGLALLSVLLLALQIILGALTVWKLLNPAIVGSHLAVALLLFTSVLLLSLAAEGEAHRASPRWAAIAIAPRPPRVLPLFALAALLTYAQAVLGGAVSTHHASLVCPDWPTCHGEWFPAMEGLVGLHMAHRYGGYLLVGVMIALFAGTRRIGDAGVRAAAQMTLSLTLAQAVLGISNILLGTPVWLSAAHLATATAILALTVTGTYRVASIPALPAAGRARQGLESASETGGGV
jgi:cytochrome c oxidase assembly protein subunit 15